MTAAHPYQVRIEADPLNALRFRWTVCEGVLVHMRSARSYATRLEARAEAEAALAKLVASQPRRTDSPT
jgi:hypothetical protein